MATPDFHPLLAARFYAPAFAGLRRPAGRSGSAGPGAGPRPAAGRSPGWPGQIQHRSAGPGPAANPALPAGGHRNGHARPKPGSGSSSTAFPPRMCTTTRPSTALLIIPTSTLCTWCCPMPCTPSTWSVRRGPASTLSARSPWPPPWPMRAAWWPRCSKPAKNSALATGSTSSPTTAN